MGLQEIVDDLVAGATGAISAVLVDWEGEAVVTATRNGQGDYEIKFLGAHHGLLLDRTRELARRLRLGETREIAFSHERFNILTAPVNGEYLLVLTLEPSRHPILARGPFREAIRLIRQDIG